LRFPPRQNFFGEKGSKKGTDEDGISFGAQAV
jgi:hypothetical protein